MTTALERVLLAAAQHSGDDGAHEHLMGDCSWYAKICHGDNPGDPTDWKHCQPAKSTEAPPAVVVKLTPRTPEASTVVKPTVPPGGPGLFHVKGMHLPPYMEHLWFHLVARYGKHKAYQVANGVVHKWAEGINPGGKHPTKTHPDVRAAAQKNIAEWEKDKAEAHNHAQAASPHPGLALASAAPIIPGRLIDDAGKTVAIHPIPDTPAGDKQAVSVFTAHRVNDMQGMLAHAWQRVKAVQKSKTRAIGHYHLLHLDNHLAQALAQLHTLMRHIHQHYPAESAELKALTQTVGCAKSTDTPAKVSSFAHLVETIGYQLAHAKRHSEAMLKAPTQASWDFNLDHVTPHTAGAVEHLGKLAVHIKDNYPQVARYLKWLEQIEDDGEVKYAALAADAANPWGRPFERDGHTDHQKPPKASGWPAGPAGPPPSPSSATAPGAKPFAAVSAQLRHVPSQTVQAAPPLPLGVTIPTPAEVRTLAKQVAADDGPGRDIVTGSVKHLEDAALKLSKDDPIAALASLRSAQTGIYAAHKMLVATSIPVANVFTVASKVPPAAASSAHSAMAETLAEREKFRSHYMTVSGFIDRIRRAYFHGMYGGMATARLTAELQVIAAAEVVQLARRSD